MTNQDLNILVVEDDLVIIHDITKLLRKEGFKNVFTANTPTKAIDRLANRKIDLALLDINLGKEQNGIDIAKIIKEKYTIPFVFLTSYSDKGTLSEALAHNPNGYLVKPFQEDTLVSTIYLALQNFKADNTKINFDKLTVELTKKEKEILKHLAEGTVYQQIADKEFISLNTVRFHVKNIYQKFGVKSNTELIVNLMKNG